MHILVWIPNQWIANGMMGKEEECNIGFVRSDEHNPEA